MNYPASSLPAQFAENFILGGLFNIPVQPVDFSALSPAAQKRGREVSQQWADLWIAHLQNKDISFPAPFNGFSLAVKNSLMRATIEKIKPYLFEGGKPDLDALSAVLAKHLTGPNLTILEDQGKWGKVTIHGDTRRAHLNWAIIAAVRELDSEQRKKLSRAGKAALALSEKVNEVPQSTISSDTGSLEV